MFPFLKMPARVAGCLAVSAAFAAFPAIAQETLPAYSSYIAVPFVVGQGGLAADLVDYLNAKLAGKARFTLTQLPRERLNQTLQKEGDFKGVVLFMNPAFVGDADRKQYHWTPAIMADSNAVISRADAKVEYNGPDSLKGLRFAGVLGNRYAGLEEHFGKDIQRDNANEEFTNIKKLAAGRADVTIMAFSTYRYLMKQAGDNAALKQSLYVSTKPHASFDRFIFSAKGDAALAKEIDAVAAGMKSDPAWKAILAKYAID